MHISKEFAPCRGARPCPQGGRPGSCAAVMNFSHPIAIAPSVVPSFPGSGHTCVSCPHPYPLYLRNIPSPKNDCPNMASSLNSETAETASSMSALLAIPTGQISITSAVSSPPDEHGPAVHSVPPPRTLRSHRLPVLLLRQPLLPLHAKSDTGTSVPIQCDTDNAISSVITYETGCSLFPPLRSKLRQQLDVRIAVSGFLSHTHPGPA